MFIPNIFFQTEIGGNHVVPEMFKQVLKVRAKIFISINDFKRR